MLSPHAYVAVLACLATFAAPIRSQDIAVQWNRAALTAIRIGNSPPPVASRILAMMHAALHDAVNGIGQRYDQYLVHPNVSRRACEPAAGTSAAHDVLVAAYPTQRQTIDHLNTTILAGIPDGEAKTSGIAWGQQVAREIIAARTNDGSEIPGSYPGSTEPGKWRPHRSFGGQILPALLPAWGGVRPFALRSGSQFRPPPPPALESLQYAIETWIVQMVGASEPRLRTPDQTQIAQFWSYGPNTATPPGHWNQIAQVIIAQRRDRLDQNVRLLALLNIALADAAIVSWDCKYRFGLWRPITAIPLAGQDRNPLTIPEPNWEPLLATPPFPEYTSGHSAFSGAAAIILTRFYGRDNIAFAVGSDDLPNVLRSYRSFSQAAWESGLSRIFGGIHYWSANILGLTNGAQAGDYIYARILKPRP